LLLGSCERGRWYIVKKIAPRNASLFGDLGVFVGRKVLVTSVFPFGGPVVVDLGGYVIAVARGAAAEVEVDPVV
jgi:Fe2+ transport system protein FeoA